MNEFLENVDMEVVDFDEELAELTMTDPKYDWSEKQTDMRGEE